MKDQIDRRSAQLALCLLIVGSLSGCLMEVAEEGEAPSDNDGSAEVGVSIQGIWGGVAVTDYPPAVYLANLGCSGALIAPDAIVTAAHCVNDLTYGEYFNLNAFMMKDGNLHCLTCSGNPGDDFLFPVKVRWDTHYAGSSDPASDFAILTLKPNHTAFKGVSRSECTRALREDQGKPSCYYDIHHDDLARTRYMEKYGWGINSYTGSGAGVLRWGTEYMDGWSSDRNYFYADANTYRNCRGDSGGPATGDMVALNTDTEILLGTHSTGEREDEDYCTEGDGNQTWTRTAKKMWLIDAALNEDFNRTCKTKTRADYAGYVYTYKRCW